MEEEKRKKRIMEYLQWLWDKVLKKETALLERAEGSQITESKHKEIATRDEEGQQPFKKARGKQPEKYCRGAIVKMEGSNPCERYVYVGQDCLVHFSRWVINNYTYYYFLIIFFFIATPLLVLGASHSSSSVYPTPTPTPQPWFPLMAESWVLFKKHSRNLWRSTEELGSPSGTWWRARRGTWPNWRELGLQWSGDGV